jgi:peptidyl-prolyl cis-trans isomerase-like 4
MSLLLETTLGDLVIDLDIEGSPELCRNVLKLAKARCYTSTLIYHVQLHRFCQLGDPRGDGSGGCCVQSLLFEAASNNNNDTLEDLTLETSPRRFLQSQGRFLTPTECQEKGRVVATELQGIPHTIGSQFLITLEEGPDRALDGYSLHNNSKTATNTDSSSNSDEPRFLSLGQVVEDDHHVLDQIHAAYCDTDGRPYADIRIHRALVIHDPFDDPVGMDVLLRKRGVIVNNDDNDDDVTMSPTYERPSEERVPHRILASQLLMSTGDDVNNDDDNNNGEDPALIRAREEEIAKHEASSRAVVLEVLGDLPSADIKAPDNVLFVCKLNPITEDEDLELIFSRFDPSVKADIIRDAVTGDSLQYAFVQFSTPQQCAEAYFKMNNALVDDRRIKVDFSQSVSHIWDKYNQRMRQPKKLPPAPPKQQTQYPKQQQQQQQQQRGPPNYKGGGESNPSNRQGNNARNDSRQPPPPPRYQHQQQQHQQQYQKRQEHAHAPSQRTPALDEFGRQRDEDSRQQPVRHSSRELLGLDPPNSSNSRRGNERDDSKIRRGHRPGDDVDDKQHPNARQTSHSRDNSNHPSGNYKERDPPTDRLFHRQEEDRHRERHRHDDHRGKDERQRERHNSVQDKEVDEDRDHRKSKPRHRHHDDEDDKPKRHRKRSVSDVDNKSEDDERRGNRPKEDDDDDRRRDKGHRRHRRHDSDDEDDNERRRRKSSSNHDKEDYGNGSDGRGRDKGRRRHYSDAKEDDERRSRKQSRNHEKGEDGNDRRHDNHHRDDDNVDDDKGKRYRRDDRDRRHRRGRDEESSSKDRRREDESTKSR